MDIAIFGQTSLKIRGKQVTFVVDPSKEMPKTQADAAVLLSAYENIDLSRVTDSRITIEGAGGYEVGGAKISGLRTPKGILYRFLIDGITIIAGKLTELKEDGFDECEVAIINADDEFSEAFATAMEPKIIVLYGDKKEDAAKKLGAGSLTLVPKITVAKDKLPEKTEIVILG